MKSHTQVPCIIGYISKVCLNLILLVMDNSELLPHVLIPSLTVTSVQYLKLLYLCMHLCAHIYVCVCVFASALGSCEMECHE